jgi:hypothetical protein
MSCGQGPEFNGRAASQATRLCDDLLERTACAGTLNAVTESAWRTMLGNWALHKPHVQLSTKPCYWGSDILLCPPPPVFRLHGQSAEGTGDSSDARSAVLLQDHDARGGRGHHPTGLWCARLKVSPLLPSLLSLLPASLTRWHSRARALKASGLILNF